MSVVAPITIAWQGVVDSSIGQAKEVETYEELGEAIIRAREVVRAAEDLQNNNYAGSDPKAHITVHPGIYEYGSSITEEDQLQDVYITILPGAVVTDSSSTFPPDTTTNVADLNSFAETAFFSESEDTFIFEDVVEFREEVIFQQNTFPVKSVEGGDAIDVSASFGDVTVNHGNTGGATDNTDTSSFLNQVEFDDKGHVKSAQFGTVEKGVSVEDDKNSVSSLATVLNFGQNIAAVNDQNQTVTVELEGTEFEISDVENLLPRGEPLSKLGAFEGKRVKLSSSAGSFSKNEVFENSTNTEKGGIISGDVIDGTLNPQVEETKTHSANTFSPGSVGVLKMVVNGSVIIALNLNLDDNSTSKTSSNGSVLSVSSATPLNFANGDVFEERTERTGSWEIDQADLTYGLNIVKIVHEDLNQNVISETQTIRYFLENEIYSIAFGVPEFTNLSTNGSKTLSGVTYDREASVQFNADAEFVYQTVYGAGNVVSYPDTQNVSIPDEPLPELGPSEGPDTTLSVEKTLNVSEDRVIGEGVEAKLAIEDPFEGQKSSSLASAYDLLIDNYTKQNDPLTHYFESENYRADPASDFDTDLSSGAYDSSRSLEDGTQYGDQLQVTEGKVVYPSVDYSSISDGPPNPDYSSTTGQRTYYGIFENGTAVSNFVLEVDGTGRLVETSQTLSFGSDDVSIAIKVPTQTGWMDVSKPFCVGEHGDRDGAYQETNAESPNKSIGPDSEIGLTIGTKSTGKAFDNLYYRIRAPENWTGEITKMNISWGVS